MWLRGFGIPLIAAALLSVSAVRASAQYGATYEQEPVSYGSPEVNDPVARLQKRLDAGEAVLKYDDRQGYLRSVLEHLEIPVSSQMLVFSKTSFQRDRISPAAPRAVYFNDSTYIGSVQQGDVIEVSAVDPQKGAIFYTLDQQLAERPVFRRQTHNCLQCHDSSMSLGVPGHVVRSVYTDANGLPILSAGTFVTNHSSPLSERWGGWYVTGTHGDLRHMGNVCVPRPADHRAPPAIDRSSGANLVSLAERCETSPYLSPHSDIVALMVFEHQTHGQNLITRANHQTRFALRDQEMMNRALGRAADERLDSTTSRIKSACEPLVAYLLFADEMPLSAKIEGTSSFAADFSARGPRDSRGRSLQDFDLEHRMFRYPVSYLIYSEAFGALPAAAKDYVYRRLWQVLSGEDTSQKFKHLTEPVRQAIIEIVRETLGDLPVYWKP
jgi:hypothetical protein